MNAPAAHLIESRYREAFAHSRERHERAKALFPNGVTHDLRHAEPFPVYIDRAAGGRKWDIDGNEFVDLWSGHGALLLGHSPPEVVEAVQRQVSRGTHLGGCHELEIAWGERVRALVPSAERVRFTGSGTEATLMALRLCRVATGRAKFLKFAGHFHGWHDYVAPASDPPYDQRAVTGVPDAVAAHAVVVTPNDPDRLERTLAENPDIGAVILEPTGGHWGAVPVRGDFLRIVRELTRTYGQVLIFDEVITGFRVSPGGAQGHYGVTPDLTTLAKILAGGLPGGAVAGRADLLEPIAFGSGRPKVRHPGTFNGNPLSAAAGVATLDRVATGEPTALANRAGRLLRNGLNALFAERGWPWVAYGDFSMVRLLANYDGPRPPADAGDADGPVPYGGDLERLDGPKDARLVAGFRQAMLLHGVDLPGLAGMTTAAHTDEDIRRAIHAVSAAVSLLRAEGLAA